MCDPLRHIFVQSFFTRKLSPGLVFPADYAMVSQCIKRKVYFAISARNILAQLGLIFITLNFHSFLLEPYLFLK